MERNMEYYSNFDKKGVQNNKLIVTFGDNVKKLFYSEILFLK